jgi:hypothetical protein
MTEIEKAFRLYIRDKMQVKSVRLMCYASISFDKQRRAMHDAISYMVKNHPNVPFEFGKYVVCGCADDLTGFFHVCFPDFMERFGKGISIKRIEEIVMEELNHDRD